MEKVLDCYSDGKHSKQLFIRYFKLKLKIDQIVKNEPWFLTRQAVIKNIMT